MDSVRPQRRQPTRLHSPWDSPGKNSGVGCHFLQCMKVKSESEVTQLCPTLHDPVNCSLPGFSVYGIFQVRVLEWVAIAFSTLKAINILSPEFKNVLSHIAKGILQMKITDHKMGRLSWIIRLTQSNYLSP